MLHAVIMAGGTGTRFWPESRRTRPKQLLKLAGEETMIRETVARVGPLIPADRTWIVTNVRQATEIAEQLPEMPPENILVEPCGRNTAPCIGLAAIHLLRRDPDATMLVMPADHVIRPKETFQSAVTQAAAVVERKPGALVLFGAQPTSPAEGYGYIERGERLNDAAAFAYRVKSFREKPDRAAAEAYLADGNFLWNCGIFVWRAERILSALGEFEPEIHRRLLKLQEALDAERYESAVAAEFPAMKSISIDYAVLERAGDVYVLEAIFEWDDVGSWLALPRLLGADEDGNTIVGLFCGIDTKNCVVRSSSDHLVATIGLENCIVVHTPDATLIARNDDENALKALVARLEELGHDRFV